MRKAWACLRADRLGLRLTDTSPRAMLSGVRTEDGRPGGFLHVTEPSSRHCLTHRRTAFRDGAYCWFRSRRNPRWVSVIDPVRINNSTARTRSLIPRRFTLSKSEGRCLCSNTCTPWYLAEKHVTKILKCFTISAAPCINVYMMMFYRSVGKQHFGRACTGWNDIFCNLIITVRLLFGRITRILTSICIFLPTDTSANRQLPAHEQRSVKWLKSKFANWTVYGDLNRRTPQRPPLPPPMHNRDAQVPVRVSDWDKQRQLDYITRQLHLVLHCQSVHPSGLCHSSHLSKPPCLTGQCRNSMPHMKGLSLLWLPLTTT